MPLETHICGARSPLESKARRGHVSGEKGTRNKRVTLRSECGDAKLRNNGRKEILDEVLLQIADVILASIVTRMHTNGDVSFTLIEEVKSLATKTFIAFLLYSAAWQFLSRRTPRWLLKQSSSQEVSAQEEFN